jgi:hypothetical protein
LVLIIWNKKRVAGKMLCFFARKDKSVKPELCELRSSFVIWKDRAYDVYPDFVRVIRFPMGWPALFQESVPASLYDEESALPKDWVSLDEPKEGSLRLRSALDESWMKKLVQESSAQPGSGFSFNWKKVLPILALVLGGIGLIVIISMRGCSSAVPGVGTGIIDIIRMVA